MERATLEAFRHGDAEAFAAVVRAFAPLVGAIVARHWRSPFEREEAMQEIWVHAFRNRVALDAARPDSFARWLAVLARRRSIDLLRARRGPQATATPSDPDELEAIDVAPDPETVAQGDELRRAVQAFTDRLKPESKEFFELHFVQGLAYREVAGRLGVSTLRCKYLKKVLLYRARRNVPLLEALGRYRRIGPRHAP